MSKLAPSERPAHAALALDHLRRIVQSLRESSRAVERDLGITGAQLFVLQTLAKGEALSLNALAERTHTHQSSVSVVVKRLAARRLVQRRAAASDARRLELSLSARGRAIVERAPRLAQDRLLAGITALSRQDCAALATSLGKLASAMQLPAGAPAMFFEEPTRRRGNHGHA